MMQTILKSLLFLFVISFASCAKDPKKDEPETTVTSTTDEREKYIGVWNANENSAALGSGIHYSVTIAKSNTAISEITIGNFASTQSQARAVVNNTLFTLPFQNINGGQLVGGSGSFSNNVINLTYTLNLNSGRDSCVTTYSK